MNWLVTLIISLQLLAQAVFAQETKTLRVVTSNYPPYTGQGPTANSVFDNLALVVFNEAGYKVRLVYLPWSRAVKEVRTGKADAILGMWITEERKEWAEFSPPLAENALVLICLEKNKFIIQTPLLLRKKTLGLVRDYAYPASINSAGAKIEYEIDEETNFKKLLGGRIDYMLVDRGVATYLIKNRNANLKKSVIILEPPLAIQNLHIGFSKKSNLALEASLELIKSLRRLEQNGTLSKIRTEAAQQGIKILNF
jgi:polar amino acid transport system substrate-binding protein